MNEVLLDAFRHNDWATGRLIRFCREQGFTPEQLQVTGVGTYGGTRGTRAGIFLAQALNHANHHREQVCAILTGFGIEPPGHPGVGVRLGDRTGLDLEG